MGSTIDMIEWGVKWEGFNYRYDRMGSEMRGVQL
jgi:hypothetical protein